MRRKYYLLISLLAIPLGIFVAFFFFYGYSSQRIPITYYDEVMWSGRSYFFDLALHNRSHPIWQSIYSYDQPKLVEYLYGAALYPRFIDQKRHDPTLTYFTFLSRDRLLCGECIDEKNLPNGAVISHYQQYIQEPNSPEFINLKLHIQLLRQINIFVAAATVVLIYFLGYLRWGAAGGILYSSMYGTNTLIQQVVPLAHADSLLLFFMVAFYLFLYLQSIRPRSAYIIMCFLCIGFASSTKIVGLVLLLPMGLHLLSVYSARGTDRTAAFNTISGTLFGISMMSVIFLWFNPYLQTHTVERAKIMYQHRVDQELDAAKEDPDNRLISPYSRIISVIERLYDGKHAYAYPTGTMQYGVPLRWIYGLFFALGITSSFIARNDKRKLFARYFFIICTAALLSTMELWLMIGWGRYYAYIIPLVLGITTEGVLFLGRGTRSFMNPKTPLQT